MTVVPRRDVEHLRKFKAVSAKVRELRAFDAKRLFSEAPAPSPLPQEPRMTSGSGSGRCPHCGRDIHPPSRQAELVELLSRPLVHSRPARWEGDWVREVYISRDGAGWYLTYAGDLPAYRPFQQRDIDALVASGTLISSYPGRETARFSYRLAPLSSKVHGV